MVVMMAAGKKNRSARPKEKHAFSESFDLKPCSSVITTLIATFCSRLHAHT
jgi:hypothetical protein